MSPLKIRAGYWCAVLSVLVSFSGLIFAQVRRGSADNEEVHGGIEIGAKGVKAVALRIGTDDEGYNVKILYAETVNTTVAQTKNNKFTPAAIKETGAAVQRFYLRLLQDYRITPEQIHIIGSSGLLADNLPDLAAEIRQRTGQSIPFLDTETEVQLSIAGAIPRRYRSGKSWYDNRSASVLIDIGSGNTKGGYQQIRQVAVGTPDYDYVTWGVMKGTVTFTNEINKSIGETADLATFTKRAQMLSSDSIRVPIHNEVARKPGLVNRRKVYLSGGIVWAMATLLHPEDRRSFTPVTIDDILTFYNRAVTDPIALLNPDLSKIRDRALAEIAEREVDSVRNTFTPKNLIAGAEILRAVAAEMNLGGKQLYFTRYGTYSWILSYVRLQAER